MFVHCFNGNFNFSPRTPTTPTTTHTSVTSSLWQQCLKLSKMLAELPLHTYTHTPACIYVCILVFAKWRRFWVENFWRLLRNCWPDFMWSVIIVFDWLLLWQETQVFFDFRMQRQSKDNHLVKSCEYFFDDDWIIISIYLLGGCMFEEREMNIMSVINHFIKYTLSYKFFAWIFMQEIQWISVEIWGKNKKNVLKINFSTTV